MSRERKRATMVYRQVRAPPKGMKRWIFDRVVRGLSANRLS